MSEPALPDTGARVRLKQEAIVTQVPSLVTVWLEVVLSRHDVNVVYRPEHCGQSGDISDDDDSDDGVSRLFLMSPAPHVSPRITLSLVIIMGTARPLITPDHSARITNDRIMYVFGLINTKTNNQNNFEKEVHFHETVYYLESF